MVQVSGEQASGYIHQRIRIMVTEIRDKGRDIYISWNKVQRTLITVQRLGNIEQGRGTRDCISGQGYRDRGFWRSDQRAGH